MMTYPLASIRIFFLTLLVVSSFSAQATEILVWDTKPLKLRLEVSKERIVVFPDNIEIAMPEQVLKRISISSSAGKAYITAKAPFPESRIEVTLVSTNEIVYIDLFSVVPNNDRELEIVKIITNKEQKENTKRKDEFFKDSAGITIKELIQHASHDFFAPSRLKITNRPIRESVVRQNLNLDLLFMGRSAALFKVKPLKQYQTTRYTLTAILITNRTATKQMIVYRDMYPNFEAVSSQHKDVGPIGSLGESTVVYLITKRPLSEDPIYAI